MTTTFTAIDPAGVTHKRTSKGRTYSHTVVYKEGQAYADRRVSAIEATRVSTEKSYTRLESTAANNPEPGRHSSVWAHDTAFAIGYLAEHPSREVYVAKQVAHAQEQFNDMIAAKRYLAYSNAGWCGRLELAQRLAASLSGRGYEDIRILTAKVTT